nr:nascent polypeptide-associated complex subunit alpha, muscle-specific form-like [Oryctolagus cuniculus]
MRVPVPGWPGSPGSELRAGGERRPGRKRPFPERGDRLTLPGRGLSAERASRGCDTSGAKAAAAPLHVPGGTPTGRASSSAAAPAAGGGRRRGLAAEPSGGTGAAAPSRGLRHRQRRRRCASSGPRAAAPPLPRAGRAGGAALRAPRPRLALARRARQLGGWRVLPGTPVSRAPLSGRGASGALGAQLPRCARFPPPSTSSLGYPQARTPESPLVSGDHQAWGPDLAAAGLSRRGAPAYRVLRRRAPKEWPRVTPALGPGESGFRRQRQPGGLPWRCLALVPGRPSEAVICSALTTCVCLPPVPGRHLQRELPGLTDRHTRLLGKKEGLLRSPGKAEPRQPQLATACPRLQPLRTSTGRGLCAESRLTRRHICWEGRGQLKYLHARFFRKQVPEEMPAFQDPLQGGKSREYGTSAERCLGCLVGSGGLDGLREGRSVFNKGRPPRQLRWHSLVLRADKILICCEMGPIMCTLSHMQFLRLILSNRCYMLCHVAISPQFLPCEDKLLTTRGGVRGTTKAYLSCLKNACMLFAVFHSICVLFFLKIGCKCCGGEGPSLSH